jgi:hypothetical protein
MDLATFRQALICCDINQALARNSINAKGYNNMEVFAHYLANDKSVMDFVKSVNKLQLTRMVTSRRSRLPRSGCSKPCAIGQLNVSAVD